MPNAGDDFTRRLLTDAGLSSGMHVLDVGCGRGDVSALIAGLVGDRGRVLGIDRDPSALAVARERPVEPGNSEITYLEADLDAAAAHGPFDAVVGRRVLMYQPDAVATLRRLAEAVRPGGLVIFQEHDSTATPISFKPLPLHERVHGWMWRTVEREGADIHMGFGLAAALTGAGLTVESVRAEAIVQTPTHAHWSGTIVRAMLPRITRHGVATEEEIDVETLDRRLQEERETTGASFIGELVFGAWARKPE